MEYTTLQSKVEFVRNGANIKQLKTCQTGIPITRIETLSNGVFNYDKLGYANILDDKYESYYLKDNDVLLSHINSAKFVGRSVLYKQADIPKIIHGMNLLCIRFIKDAYLPNFFVWYTKSNRAKLYFVENTKHAVNQASITSTAIKEMPIPNIDIVFQKAISDNLNIISNAISLAKQRLLALDELVKSRFIEMFGNPDINEKGWQISKLENHINVLGGYAFKSQKYSTSGIPVLRIGNINAGIFKDANLVFYQEDKALEKYKVYPNDLVLSLTGTSGKDDYGNICLLDETYDEYYLNQRNAKIDIKSDFNRLFLMYLFAHPNIKQKLTGNNHGARQGNILNKDILELSVYIPPISLQNEFAEFVKLIDKSKFIVQQQIKDLEELLDSKMDEYFR